MDAIAAKEKLIKYLAQRIELLEGENVVLEAEASNFASTNNGDESESSGIGGQLKKEHENLLGANRRANRCQEHAVSVEQERDAAKGSWKAEIAAKEAMKELLLVTGIRFGLTEERIGTAAKAVSEGKKPRLVLSEVMLNADTGMGA